MYLKPGSFMVEFNETVDLPADVSSFVLPRSSILRSGAVVQAGLLDPGYSGAVGAILTVNNPNGLILGENARIAQWVFERLSKKASKGYSGKYQKAKNIF
jgi:dUTP pyrophosphatase